MARPLRVVYLALAAVFVICVQNASAQSPPTISDMADQKVVTGQASTPVGFSIADPDTDVALLTVSASSDNTTLIPNNNITLSGTGDARTITFTSAAGQTGTATLTVTVSDGALSASDTVTVTVIPPPTLYIATLRPEGAAVTSASGSATLMLSGDETSAVLRFSYANLTTAKIAEHIHGPADPGVAGQIIFDIDVSPMAEDGSYTWSIEQSGNVTAAEQVAAIKAGRTYLNIHTSRFPGGELRGHFTLATGSQTFTPPPAPPPLPGGPPSANEAARFLTQLSFGPTTTLIQDVRLLGYDNYLAQQLSRPTSTLTSYLTQRAPTLPPPGENDPITNTIEDVVDDAHVAEAWWRAAITGPDQLRHRVAWAYAQIFVISFVSDDIGGSTRSTGMANYHDMLAQNAFGNFRTILERVTLNPMMGRYLDMKGNRYEAGTGRNPNENYAREILQLFSIGTYLVHPDGTLKLGPDGQPIAAYDQSVVEAFAQVFTGWDDGTSPAPARYIVPMTVRSQYHSPLQKRLLSYSGNYTASSPDRFTLPAVGASSTTHANGELKAALDNIFQHPNTGPFISRQLIQRLVTVNPSPGYVYRVAQKFNNNGSGTRGDMKAVIKAILSDYEARSPDMLNQQGFGKLREPILRYTAFARAFNPTTVSGHWIVTSTATEFEQRPFYSPTVFNYYEPGYGYVYAPRYANNPAYNPTPAQKVTLSDMGLVAPEFQILNDSTAIRTINLFTTNMLANPVSLKGGDVRLDFTRETQMASNPDALLDHLNLLLCAGQLSTDSRNVIRNHLLTLTNPADRAKAAVHLMVCSPDFTVQK